VLIAGKLAPAEPRLIGLLQVARVVVLQSISETFGLVILEAWAAGTPAISSRTSGPAALLQPDENGWLFDLERPETFHAVADTALTDEAARARVIAAGRTRVKTHYDTRILAQRIKDLYVQLKEKHHALRHSA
jgi:glycosyltransferase involved in cell wall biosynthesis